MEGDISIMREFKPNIQEVIDRYRDFWSRELTDRILALVGIPLKDVPPMPGDFYTLTHGGKKEWKKLIVCQEAVFRKRRGLKDDVIPTVRPELGPTFTGALLGFSDMKLGPGTSWAVPLLDTWDKLDQVGFDPDNKWFKKCVSLIDFMVSKARGRYMVGLPDMHSTGDMMAACRGTITLIKDLYTNPREVDKLARMCTDALIEMVDAILGRISSLESGVSLGWIPVWAPGKGYIMQEDFSALLSPEKYGALLRPHDQQITDCLDSILFHTHDSQTHLIPEMAKIRGLEAVEVCAHAHQSYQPYEPLVRSAMQVLRGKMGVYFAGAQNLQEVERVIEIFGQDGLLVTMGVSSIEEGNKLLEKLKALTPHSSS